MTDGVVTSFRTFLERDAAELLSAVARATGNELAVLDPNGTRLASFCGSGGRSLRSARAVDAPVIVRGETIAVLHAKAPRRLEPLVLAVARDVSARFLAEFDLENMTDRLSQCYDELNLLFRLAGMQRHDERFEESCRSSLRETADFMEGRSLFLYLNDRKIREACTGGLSEPKVTVRAFLDDHPRQRQLFRSIAEVGLHVVEDGPDRHTGRIGQRGGKLQYVAVPIWSRDEVVGFVAVLHDHTETDPSTDELRLIECLAAQLSGAQTTRRLYHEIKDALFNTVSCLVAAIDAKDAYTKGHSERVYRLSVKLGERLGLGGESLQNLAWSALLHDIGKIAIPVQILTKPTQLTKEEFALIKTHPARGCTVLEPIPQFRPILPGIRSHHERYDGRGYPDGLAGERIPLMARIIAVADSFDAMVSSRAYRAARTVESAVEEIERSAGTQLDPVVVAAFLSIVADDDVDVPSAATRREAA